MCKAVVFECTRLTIPRCHGRVDAVLHEGAVLFFPAVAWLRGSVGVALGAPAIPDISSQIARVHGLHHAQYGQRNRALGNRDDLAHGLAGAVGAARVAVEVALGDARRQVGAAQLDVIARLGREALPRKLELAAWG